MCKCIKFLKLISSYMTPQIPYVIMTGEGALGPSTISEIEDITRQTGLISHALEHALLQEICSNE